MATEMVRTNDISTMYSAITMLRAIGGSVSGPVYAWLYTAGLTHQGKAWLGLPYLIAGALFVLALSILVMVRDPEKNKLAADDEAREPLLA
jgi:hypothetical protein